MSAPTGGADGGRALPRLWRYVTALVAGPFVYLTHRVPMYRRDRVPERKEAPDLHRDLPGDPETVQRARDGVGTLFHRHYWIEMTDTDLTPEQLIDRVAGDLNRVTPTVLSRFEAERDNGSLEVGDELVVRLPGPWDGPVRCIDRTATSFRFATLDGHMEAGEIEFRTSTTDRGFVRFEIESWARSGSRLFHTLYERVPVAREVQLLMWSAFCQQVAKLSGGIVMSNVQSVTEKVSSP